MISLKGGMHIGGENCGAENNKWNIRQCARQVSAAHSAGFSGLILLLITISKVHYSTILFFLKNNNIQNRKLLGSCDWLVEHKPLCVQFIIFGGTITRQQWLERCPIKLLVNVADLWVVILLPHSQLYKVLLVKCFFAVIFCYPRLKCFN